MMPQKPPAPSPPPVIVCPRDTTCWGCRACPKRVTVATMNTKTLSTIGAVLSAAGGALVLIYVPDADTRVQALTVLGIVCGWLGFRKPGT